MYTFIFFYISQNHFKIGQTMTGTVSSSLQESQFVPSLGQKIKLYRIKERKTKYSTTNNITKSRIYKKK